MKISDSEWRVMQVIWAQGPIGAAEVIEALTPQTGWSHRTVRSLLNRLVDKGVLSAKLEEGRNIYRSRVRQSQCVRQESQSFLKRVFNGDAAQMLTHFVKNEEMTPRQIEQLKELLNAKQSSSGKKPTKE